MKFKQFKRNLKSEYKDTFRKERHFLPFNFKVRYAVFALLVLMVIFLVGNHGYVYYYNSTVDAKIEKRIENTKITKVDSKGEYKSLVNNYSLATKESILSKILNFQLVGCAAKGSNMAPGEEINESFLTNVQVDGIDEADVSKCDGTYIYAVVDKTLFIYDLNGNVVSSQYCNGYELYVSDKFVITIGPNFSKIYKFDKNVLEEIYSLEYSWYIESRLKDNHIYFVVSSLVTEDNIDYGNCYYDGLCNPRYVYSIIDFDLITLESNMVQSLSGYDVIFYMSNSHFYLTSYCYLNNQPVTSIMVFNNELEPTGIIKLFGTVLNQFSLDENNGYLRVVSTDSTQMAERLNAISIFDVETLELVGYLNEGIGIGRQIVKSVTYSGDNCFVVTYENKDPLYKIDCSDPTKPNIVSKYEAPGYSNYLYSFKMNNQEYVLGLGYTDSRVNTKISLYINQGSAVQVGEDFILGYDDYYDVVDYKSEELRLEMFENHKALFFYNDNQYLYLGVAVSTNEYVIFKIDVTNDSKPITIYKNISMNYEQSRAYLIDGNLYIVDINKLIISSFNSN